MSEAQMHQPLLEVKGLKEYFDINMGFFRTKPLKAVDDVSFTINKGETLGLVGESGCGKTTVGRTILQLYKPTAGEIIYDGKPVKTKADLQKFRTKATMVFQDPYSSLNPRMTVSDIVGEPLDVHHLYSSKKEREERILQLLGYVGLNSEHASRYAHEFSGGQRQRQFCRGDDRFAADPALPHGRWEIDGSDRRLPSGAAQSGDGRSS